MTEPNWARESEVKVGTRLEADGGFTCLKEGTIRTVEQGEKGGLFVPCSEGRHWIAVQLDGRDRYIGFRVST